MVNCGPLRTGALVLLTSLFLGTLCAQQPPAKPPTKPDDDTIRISTERVVLDAMVLEKNTNRSVAGLSKANFNVLEDDVRQELDYFNVGERPLAVMLIIDTSKTVRDALGMLRTNLLDAQFNLRPRDQFGVMLTAERTELIQDLTRDRVATGNAIRNFDDRRNGDDGIFLHDAVARAVLQIRKTADKESRKVIIVVSDNVSRQTRHFDYFSEKETDRILFESDVAICGLVMPNGKEGFKEAWRRGLANPKLSPGSIFDYAERTGGEAIKTDAPDAGRRLGDLFERLRARYVIGYESSNPARDGKFRKLKVEIVPTSDRPLPPCVVKTRRGYYKR